MADISNSDLYVATYDGPYEALRDFRALEGAVDDGLDVLGAIAMLRQADGKVDFLVAAEDAGEHVDWFGGATGIIVGLFAPELLLSAASRRRDSASLRRLIRAHDEGRMGIDLDEAFPPESAVVVLVVAPNQVHRVDGVLLHAGKVTTYRIEDEDFDLVRAALATPNQSVET